MTIELVGMKNNQVVTSSRQVAENFGKRHDHTLRDIRNIKKDIEGTQKWGHLFQESEYEHPQNKQVYKEFLMNRDGFTLLAMGFTGKDAMEWKLRYIEAFNEMEKGLPIHQQDSYTIEDPIERAKAWIVEQEKRDLLEEDNQKKSQIIGELKPKADYTDTILNSDSLITITQIAKDYGMSGEAMNKLLNELKVQYKMGSQWLLFSHHQSKSYTHSNTISITKSNGAKDTKMHTKWTQKGRLFIYNLLKSKDVLPLIERKENSECQGDIEVV